MYDKELTLEVLNQIYKAVITLLERFEPVYERRVRKKDAF